jgi:hypothetical protein
MKAKFIATSLFWFLLFFLRREPLLKDAGTDGYATQKVWGGYPRTVRYYRKACVFAICLLRTGWALTERAPRCLPGVEGAYEKL